MKIVGIVTWGPLPSSTKIIFEGSYVVMLSAIIASLPPWFWDVRDLVVNVQSPLIERIILFILPLASGSDSPCSLQFYNTIGK